MAMSSRKSAVTIYVQNNDIPAFSFCVLFLLLCSRFCRIRFRFVFLFDLLLLSFREFSRFDNGLSGLLFRRHGGCRFVKLAFCE